MYMGGWGRVGEHMTNGCLDGGVDGWMSGHREVDEGMNGQRDGWVDRRK